MSKISLLSKVKYSPSFDSISVGLGCNTSTVLGKILLYSEMGKKVCQVSQERLAFELGLSLSTIKTIIDECEIQRFIIDHTPILVNRPHTYSIQEEEIIKFDKKYEEALELFYNAEQELILSMDEQSIKKYTNISKNNRRFRGQYIHIMYEDFNWYFRTTYNKKKIQLTKMEEIIPF